jgi:pilus assembly protein CpaC
MKKLITATVLIICGLAMPVNRLLSEEEREVARFAVGETRVFPVRAPSRVVIGNPAVADVADVSNTELAVNAKSVGSTTLTFWDAFGEQAFRIRVTQEDMPEIKSRADALIKALDLPDVYTKPAEDEGRILVLGKVKRAADKERITNALATLKANLVDLVVVKEEEAVVEIDVQVLELDKGASRALGLTWPGSITLTEQGSPAIATGGSWWEDLFRTLKVSRTQFTLTLYMLEEEGKARVLSRPRLSCQSGKEAKLLVGGEMPIYTSTTTASSSAVTTGSVDYKEYGIILNIKPEVMDRQRIKLGLKVEVSEVSDYTADVTYAKAFPITKRSATTELFLNNEQTMAIGGLMKQKMEQTIRKTPILGDIPFLGALFRKKSDMTGSGASTKGDTELFIILTPRIVPQAAAPEAMPPAALTKLAPVAETPAEEIPAQIAGYAKVVQAKILRYVYYPRQAQDAGWEGKVKISLNIVANGDLKDIKVKQSSGYKVLDNAAEEAARHQSPYPPFPPQIDSQELWIDVPIIYKKS